MVVVVLAPAVSVRAVCCVDVSGVVMLVRVGRYLTRMWDNICCVGWWYDWVLCWDDIEFKLGLRSVDQFRIRV